MKGEGGTRKWLMIRRFRCSKCMKLHNELPGVVLPYKHYDSEVISGVLEKVVTPDDLDSEDYLNITVRQSRQSGVARATCPD